MQWRRVPIVARHSMLRRTTTVVDMKNDWKRIVPT